MKTYVKSACSLRSGIKSSSASASKPWSLRIALRPDVSLISFDFFYLDERVKKDEVESDQIRKLWEICSINHKYQLRKYCRIN